MKSVALILCFVIVGALAASVGDSAKTKLKKVHKQCQVDSATNVDGKYFKKLKHGKNPEEPANLGAHYLCMSKGLGLQNEDGSLNKQAIREKVETGVKDQSLVEGIVSACSVEKETHEATARHLFECYYAHKSSFRDSEEESDEDSHEHHHKHHHHHD